MRDIFFEWFCIGCGVTCGALSGLTIMIVTTQFLSGIFKSIGKTGKK